VLAGLTACWTNPPPAAPPVTTVPAALAATCDQAIVGIDRGTRDLLPDTDHKLVAESLRNRCAEDNWPQAALDCFKTMGRDDLGRCSELLPPPARDKFFTALSNGTDDERAELAIAVAQLKTISVGIPECDNFVIAVGRILECKEYPLSARVTLAKETVDFWALPNNGKLPQDAIKRMATVCDQSRGELEQRAVGAGCKL
jgi:hypothetical protein